MSILSDVEAYVSESIKTKTNILTDPDVKI